MLRLDEITHVFYAPGALSIQDVAVQRDGEWFGFYSGDTQAAMAARTGAVLTGFDEACERCTAAQRAAWVKPPTQITAREFDEALSVLPPARWTNMSQTESFHISERLSGDLVNWYVRTGTRYFTFVESASLTHSQLVALAMGKP